MDGLKVVELVCLFQMYYSETGQDNLKGFSSWLSKNAENGSEEENIDEDLINKMILDSIIRLSKFVKINNKEVFQNHIIKSIDEYKFLLAVESKDNPAKSDIYSETITELTTGAKIMKRLITLGLIRETDDKLDKRIKRVKLTPKGKNEIDAIKNVIDLNNNQILAYLSLENKEQLLINLKEIDDFNTERYLRASNINSDIDE